MLFSMVLAAALISAGTDVGVSDTELTCIVGTGTSASCTESALDACLPGGAAFNGALTFDCGADPVTITVTGTKAISANTSLDGGGLITLSGGGIVQVLAVNAGVTLTLANLTIANGIADGKAGKNGGAIDNGGTLNVTNSTFSGNSATSGYPMGFFGGGAIWNHGTLSVTNSTFTGNSSVSGGGAIWNAGTLNVTNSTFSGNSATVGLPMGFGGGAILNGDTGIFDVTNSTFFTNTAVGNAGAIVSTAPCCDACGTCPPTTLRNTIVANSTPWNCSGTLTDGGHNLDSDGTCGVGPATDPLLDPAGLANHGGPTQTVALLAGSPAINAGDETVCAAAPVNNLDQRGYARPGTGYTNCSIGAYEFGSPGPPPPCAGDCNGDGRVVVNEIVVLVNITLGNTQPVACQHGVPSGAVVNVAVIIQAVNNALDGCAASPRATPRHRS